MAVFRKVLKSKDAKASLVVRTKSPEVEWREDRHASPPAAPRAFRANARSQAKSATNSQ